MDHLLLSTEAVAERGTRRRRAQTRGALLRGAVSAALALVPLCARAATVQVGFTSPHNKVYFNAPSEFAGAIRDSAQIELARNEYESVQMVLFPQAGLTQVQVDVGPLTRFAGADVLPAEDIEVRVVGYVNQVAARIPGDRVGWIPDPLLPNQRLDLASGVLQPYLITVRTRAGTAEGLYEGPITIRASGAVLHTALFQVRVWDFTLPHTPTLKTTSLSFRSDPDDMWPGQVQSEAHRDTLLFRLADLGFRNRIPPTGALANGLDSWTWPDSGYTRYGYPTHDGEIFNAERTGRMIDFMLDRGANMFLLCYTFDIYGSCCPSAPREAALKKYLADYRAYLQSRGLLSMAYVYNIDEPWGAEVQHAKNIYSLIKNEVGSDVRVMQNTNQNNGTIIGTFLGYFDALNINLGHYYINQVDSYRASYPQALADLWWNVNIWPDSHPNLFLEYPLTDARIFGPMSYKFDVQGFEYWNVKSQWSIGSYHPVDSNDLRVQWNVTDESLDGSLVYPGSRFEVFSSMRFESFRDGMEDYEYLVLLEAHDPTDPLLNVEIVTDLDTYATDPFEVQEYRTRLGERLSSVSTDASEPARPEAPHAGPTNTPNPFNARTEIEFSLDRPDEVSLTVFNVLGRRLASIHRGALPAGRHRFPWNGLADDGSEAPTGVYLCRLSTSERHTTRRMLLLR